MLYLIDKPMADVGIRTAADDPEAHVVLVQDGVYLSPDVDAQVSAVAKDVDTRGVVLPPGVDRISYGELVELIVEDGVCNFA